MSNANDFIIKNGVLVKYIGTDPDAEIIIPDGVTEIGYEAFRRSENIKMVVIPEGITNIGSEAFFSCTGLISVMLPNSLVEIGTHAFWECLSLTSIVLCDDITKIGYGAFLDCKSLKHLTIPNNVDEINYEAFCGCENLETISLPAEMKINRKWFEGFSKSIYPFVISHPAEKIPTSEWKSKCALYYFSNPAIAEQLTKEINESWLKYFKKNGSDYYDQAFRNKEIMKRLLDLGGVSTKDINMLIKKAEEKKKKAIVDLLAEYKNKNLSNKQKESLQKQSKPISTVHELKKLCKYKDDDKERGTIIITNYNGNEKSVVIPAKIGSKSVVSIEYEVNSNFSKLEEITISDGIEKIGQYAFSKCRKLKKVVIPDSIKEIDVCAFDSCSKLEKIHIPTNVSEISAGAFRNCKKLMEMSLGEDTRVCNQAFKGCIGLADDEGMVIVNHVLFDYIGEEQSVNIPNDITEISGYAFDNKKFITEIYMPKNLISIGEYAFHGCKELKDVVLPLNLANIHWSAFQGCKNLIIHAPAGSYAEKYAKENNIPFVAE